MWCLFQAKMIPAMLIFQLWQAFGPAWSAAVMIGTSQFGLGPSSLEHLHGNLKPSNTFELVDVPSQIISLNPVCNWAVACYCHPHAINMSIARKVSETYKQMARCRKLNKLANDTPCKLWKPVIQIGKSMKKPMPSFDCIYIYNYLYLVISIPSCWPSYWKSPFH